MNKRRKAKIENEETCMIDNWVSLYARRHCEQGLTSLMPFKVLGS